MPDAVGRDGSASPSDAPAADRRFPRNCRLTARGQFVTVYEQGWRANSPSFTLFGRPNGLAHCRLGLTVSRKVGGAVVRNRAKRMLRELFRVRRHDMLLPMDLVVNVRTALLECDRTQLDREWMRSYRDLARRAAP